MSKIEFACNNASYASALQMSLGATPATVEDSKVIVSLSSASTSFTVASLTGGQVSMDSITVYYAE
jgi:DNA-binding transcriptional regulator YdaS (Cro superfamily)